MNAPGKLLAGSLAALAVAAAAPRALADEVDDFVLAEMKSRGIPGLAVGVVRNGEVVKLQGYGHADLAAKSPVTARTAFQLASLTKQFVASGIMLLVTDGKLKVDDPIGKYLPDLATEQRPISIRQLLTHTSGLGDYLASPEARTWDAQRDRGLRALVRRGRLEFTPCEKWRYSNTGYVILGQLIESVSGEPYDRFLARRLFGPLGMKDTHRRVVGAKNLAVGYLALGPAGKQAKAPPLSPFLWDNGDGGLVSTVEDLTRWELALASGRPLGKAAIDEMYTKVRLADGKFQDYGYGMVVNVVGRHRIVGHGGGRPGAGANFTRWLDDGITVAVLANTKLEGNGSYELARGVARRFVANLP